MMSLNKRKRDAEYTYNETGNETQSRSKSEKKGMKGQGSQVQATSASKINHVESLLAQARQVGLIPSNGDVNFFTAWSNVQKKGSQPNQDGVQGSLHPGQLTSYSEERRQKNQTKATGNVVKRRKIESPPKPQHQPSKRRPPPKSGQKQPGSTAVDNVYVENLIAEALAAQVGPTAPSQMSLPKFETIEKKAEYPPPLPPIHDKKLEQQCFTHPSYIHDPVNHSKALSSLHYERLEFLGDSYMNYCVTKILYNRLPDLREGELTRFRSQIISNENIRQYAKMYGFNERILLGVSAEKDDVRDGGKKIADIFEAYIGGILTDQPDTGEETVFHWMKAVIAPQVEQAVEIAGHLSDINKNAKQELYVLTDAAKAPAPVYVVTKEGSTNTDFEVACLVQGKEMGRGIGKNKNEAGTRAAMSVLQKWKVSPLIKNGEKVEDVEGKKGKETDGNSDAKKKSGDASHVTMTTEVTREKRS
jgi:dsRNA-specific ribonuclease